MESSRGGPLTTFIMMLPLIVVPAIAMLKPADLQNGLISDLLSAASGKPNATANNDNPSPTDPDDLTAEFAETPEFDSEFSELNAPLFDESQNATVAQPNSSRNRTPPETSGASPFDPPEDGSDKNTEPLLIKLRQMGAQRTMWFSPGNKKSFGFVAFFTSADGLVRYRFETVGATKVDAVRDVLEQATAWAATQK